MHKVLSFMRELGATFRSGYDDHSGFEALYVRGVNCEKLKKPTGKVDWVWMILGMQYPM